MPVLLEGWLAMHRRYYERVTAEVDHGDFDKALMDGQMGQMGRINGTEAVKSGGS